MFPASNLQQICYGGDVLWLMKCIVTINNLTESAIKCVKVVDGVHTCTVSYVPHVLGNLKHVQGHLNKFVQMVELYSKVENSFKQSKSFHSSRASPIATLEWHHVHYCMMNMEETFKY